MSFAELPAALPEEQLALRRTLPAKPDAVTLTGRLVWLEPLDVARDAAVLYALSDGSAISLGSRQLAAYDADALVWRFMFAGPFATQDEFALYLSNLVALPNALAMTVFDQATRQPVGVACYLNNAPADLKIELGSISYSPIVQGTGANTEATYLMLKHAFELGYRRLEWKCNALNERSRRSALRMGFQFEGIQDSHMVVKGRNRDTAWFRILASEWGGVQARIEALLASYS